MDASSDTFLNCCMGFPARGDREQKEGRVSATATVMTPEVIKEAVPDAKAVLMLREPVSRLFSDYMYFNRSGKAVEKTADTFHEACSVAVDLLQKCLSSSWGADLGPQFVAIPGGREVIPSFANWRRCIDNGQERDAEHAAPMSIQLECPVEMSVYIYNLRIWTAVFGDDLSVVRTDDYHSNTTKTMSSLFEHVGLRQPTETEWPTLDQACSGSNGGGCNRGKKSHSESVRKVCS
eukprot:scaffold2004_cov420-Prasinococcus_capsulatus_cf.AAC.20